jgi:hypothetical protein
MAKRQMKVIRSTSAKDALSELKIKEILKTYTKIPHF